MKEIFEAIWPEERRDENSMLTALWSRTPLPYRVEIGPDLNSIPHIEEPDIFGERAAPKE